MNVSSLFSAVSVPSFVAMPGAGIDISSGSVRMVLLGAHSPGNYVYEKIPTPEGVVVDGEFEKKDALIEILNSFRQKEHVYYAHASLPERKAYLYQVIVPRGEKNIRRYVEFGLEANVPLPPSEVVFDFEVVRTIEQGTVVSVTAFARRIIDQYVEVFEHAGITLKSLEVESQAVARAVRIPEDKNRVVLVVDFGRNTTRIAVLDSGVASFTATVDVGGDALTNAVMKHYNVEAAEAEKIKNESGFLEGEKNSNMHDVLLTTISVLKDEVAKHISFWNTAEENEIPHRIIEEVVLVGGNSNLKGFSEYLARALNIPVRAANVWENAFSLDMFIPEIGFHKSFEYSTAIGLALRSHNGASW